MRTIRLSVVLGGLSVLALIFLVRVGVGQADSHSDNLNGTYSFRMVPVTSFSPFESPGSSGFAGAPYQDILRVGVSTATPDSGNPAHGSLSGKTIATIDDKSGGTRVVVFNWIGHFGVNPDGTGVFTVEALAGPVSANITCYDSTQPVAPPAITPPYPPPPPAGGAPPVGQTCDFGTATSVEGPESYAFVTKGHGDIEFIQTDNSGGGARIFLTGQASRQHGGGE